MPTPAYICGLVASLQNDTKRRYYTDEAILPYLNMSLDDLQEIYQVNDIPIVEETSAVIPVNAGVTSISFGAGLPSDLVEIKRVWESPRGLNQWHDMRQREFLPHYIEQTQITEFLYWCFNNNEINFFPSMRDNDIKIDYLRRIINTPILINQINTDLGAKFVNVVSYLRNRTAAYCSAFIGENKTRAQELSTLAEEALNRALGISVKGKQSIVTLRRPFRANYKTRSPY